MEFAHKGGICKIDSKLPTLIKNTKKIIKKFLSQFPRANLISINLVLGNGAQNLIGLLLRPQAHEYCSAVKISFSEDQL